MGHKSVGPKKPSITLPVPITALKGTPKLESLRNMKRGTVIKRSAPIVAPIPAEGLGFSPNFPKPQPL